MSLSVISLNTRGLRDNLKRKALFLFIKEQKSDFCFLQESHSTINDIKFWKNQWGNDLWFSHETERSAGVTSLKNKFEGTVLHSENDSNGRFLILIVKLDDNIVLLANIYGYNTKTDNDFLFDTLGSRFLAWLSKYPNMQFVVGGDFNVTVDDSIDRWPPKNSTNSLPNIVLFMQKFQLIDIWRRKNPNIKILYMGEQNWYQQVTN